MFWLTSFVILSTLNLWLTCTASEIFWFPNGDRGNIPAIVNYNTDLQPQVFGGSLDKEKHIHFFLYTRGDKQPFELKVGDGEGLDHSKFDKSLPSKIVIHGFTNNDNVGLAPAARAAYIESENSPLVNLIVVDWGKLAQAPWYNEAARNTQVVGVKVARFIEFLVDQGNSLDRIHVIGHSLGAHVAGIAGSNLNNMTLSRITALDVALPLFEEVSDENRIDPSDAEFVDVIHTAGGGSSGFKDRSALAFIEPRGHADFYVNGGKVQPGCGADIFGTCSHVRAYEYYFESVANPDGFPACQCDNWKHCKAGICDSFNVAYLGENCSTSSRGKFFVKTRSKKPFGLNIKKKYI